MHGLQFRAMTLGDLGEVVRVERASFASPWGRTAFAKNLTRNECVCYVATDEDRIVAYAAISFVDGCAHLLNFAVTPARRLQGIGRALVDFLFDVCRMRDMQRMDLEVRETNLDAQLFYRSLGFRATKVLRKRYQDTGEDAYFMQRTVEAAAPQLGE